MVSGQRTSAYTPTLNRNLSLASNASSPEEPPLISDGLQFNKPKRNKSLVRPERERIDSTHRQYHYRQATINRGSEHVVPSSTGNQPIRRNTLERRPTRTNKNTTLRRGRSILGREDTDDEEDEEAAKHLGIPDGPAQSAWREKIGLVSFILFIMAFVGFLTFGFTQAVCPTPPLSLHGGQINPGYVVINGWAYMLSNWQGHPPIPGATNGSTNVLYPPINGGGMDASFLFQQSPAACAETYLPKMGPQSIYFPCQLFNPNNTIPPDPSTFTNRTSCHTPTGLNLYKQFETEGTPNAHGTYDKPARVYYEWNDINTTSHLMVYNGDVLNLLLLQSMPTTYFGFQPGGLVEQILADMDSFGGKDMTRHIAAQRGSSVNWETEASCLAATIKVGSLETLSIGCMASEIVLYISLVVILGVIITKFVLAVIFGWFLSWKLGNFKEGNSYAARMQREAEIENWAQNIHTAAPIATPRPVPSVYYGTQQNKRKSLFPQTSRFTQPEHGSTRFDTPDKTPPPLWKASSTALAGAAGSRPGSAYFGSGRLYGENTNSMLRLSSARLSTFLTPRPSFSASSSDTGGEINICPFPLSPHVVPQPSADYMPFNFPLAHTICLVTCYSEGEDGIRTTLDSIATSDYPNSHKMILVVCDGLITGSGNSKSTPDVCIGMMRDLIKPAEEVEALSYVAIADGAKRNNMAKVYAGFYKYDDTTVSPEHQQRVPMITIVKCGTPDQQNEAKPGNRGKRDSQIILMQFLQKVMFDERMTTMEYEFFNCIWRVTGVPADSYEICLMVDADTKVYPDALSRLVSCAVKDPDISGLCGETKIANKTDSWVSMIQVFEYFISHHQTKAFESIFGGVTCLPGCFCMYRIKAPKGPNGYWVPILANPDIVEHYSENVIDTLHKKNLLLLGEDRYLSTLMLRTFPNRKMVFVPQAVCKTVVPDTFPVLLSQRRRWINSTIHNLMELLFVHDLCGTFCFSMQFVVFMELVGTLALPAAISFTLYLIVLAIMGKPAVIPLILLALILGLPAVLIVMTSRKIVYVGWMIVYLFSLPIWNFVLPTYAYWHFDDFSWGDTRKVEGSEKDEGHGDKEGEFDSSQITMKKWSEYEKERRVKQAIANNMPIPRFIERPLSVDIFRESQLFKRHSQPASDGSNESEVPLTQMEFSPAGADKRLRAEASGTSGFMADRTPIQLVDKEMPMTTLRQCTYNHNEEEGEEEKVVEELQATERNEQWHEEHHITASTQYHTLTRLDSPNETTLPLSPPPPPPHGHADANEQ
ncbi:Chitin synthase, class 3 [Apophysomyces ossiformis]|uniref:chitin synthase n=1 Tax=Apophysomyces ossiformis TaxID=679940 RepID=A0A8H7EN15_9FUNG|nr:Chitin synthase, class 3 [Apophysomyces ossiformis]